MEKYPPDSYYLKKMKVILDGYPQYSPPIHPTKLTDQLYIGNQDNADDVVLLQGLEITHVLNCAGTRTFDLTRSPYPYSSGIKGFLMIPAQDYDEFDIMQYFEDAIGFLDSAILSGGRAFVHCSIGVNRSGAIVAAYLLVSQRKRLLDVIVELKAKRLLILCNMGFRKQLVQFARANDLLDVVNENVESVNKGLSANTSDNQKPVEFSETGIQAIEPKKSVTSETKTSNELKKYDTTDYKTTISNINLEKHYTAPPKPAIVEPERNYLPHDFLTTNYKYKTTSKSFNPITASTFKNIRNVDPNVIVKALNESYDMYKSSNKSKDVSSPVKTLATKSLITSVQHKDSPVRASSHLNDTNVLLPYRQNLNYKMKSVDRELANEVQDFLASEKSLAANQANVGNLLDSLINKEDENIIWGKGSAEKDPKFVNLQNKLDVLRSVFSDEQSVNPRSALLTKQLKNLQHKQFVNEIHHLTENIPARKTTTTTAPKMITVPRIKSPKVITTALIDSSNSKSPSRLLTIKHKKHNYELDEEIDNYMNSSNSTSLPVSIHHGHKMAWSEKKFPKDKSDEETLRKISALKSNTEIKPMSFYRFQVMSEKKKDQERANDNNDVDEYMSTTTPTSSRSSLLSERQSSPLKNGDLIKSYRTTISNINLKQPTFKSRFLKSSYK